MSAKVLVVAGVVPLSSVGRRDSTRNLDEYGGTDAMPPWQTGIRRITMPSVHYLAERESPTF
jgi:hypothetical protein